MSSYHFYRNSRFIFFLVAILCLGGRVGISQTPAPVAKTPATIGGGNPSVFRVTDTDSFEYFEAHTLPAPKGATGVLVLITDLSRPRVPLEDAGWLEFAARHKLALTSLGFRVKPGVWDRNAVGVELAVLVEKAVETTFGKSQKKIGFAQGSGADWFLRALQAKPGAWTFWVGKGATAYPIAPQMEKGALFPPGIVMAVKPEQYEAAQRYFLDLRHIDKVKQRITFLGSDTRTLDDSFLDRFFRQYVSAIYEGRIEGDGRWCIIFAQEVSPEAGKEPWYNYSWVPNRELAGAWRLLNREHDNPALPVMSSHTIPTPVGEQKVWVRIPGEVAREEDSMPANAVMLWLTWAADAKALEGRLKNTQDPVVGFAERNRIPILAWNCKTIWPGKNLQITQDADAKGVATADQAFVKIGDAMYGKLREFCREKGWPDQGWLLSADASAGRYGLMMAQAYPFMAVQLHSASGYDRIASPPTVPWLVTCGWADSPTAQNMEFFHQARKGYWPVLFKRYPKMGHTTRWDQRVLAAEFFAHVLSLRWSEIGSHRWVGEWRKDWEKPPLPPEYRKTESKNESEVAETPKMPPGFRSNDYAPDRPVPKSPGDWFAEECRRAMVLGDYQRLDLFPRAEQKKVYPGWLVRLPTVELAEAWALTAVEPPEITPWAVDLEKAYYANLEAREKKATAKPAAEAKEEAAKKADATKAGAKSEGGKSDE